ncbi:phosphoribosylamine--glycine ligase [Thermosipho ferrireducens]|uniref:Phosphoribosylamine--glycine ligase n=1 Tax=Thermosipho ferrireducens TaxID=2571116 RepID=A0ABX7S8X5_9BACT|nr:phosphoribosylamine--glycine ligase [Thermosipho ferrireducens]QTA38300.1 phosphoribosylamine--glycine ligase [Thermosipho ferrireducens]
MKVMVIGSGGREHALAWKLAQSKRIKKIYCVPGNGGTALEQKCENVNISDVKDIALFAKENNVKLTVVGPEDYLVNGIVDEFKKYDLKIIGPDKKAASLEGSKVFAKNFAKKYGVQTANYEVFDNYTKALDYLKNVKFPVVIKADGLAAGKGVTIVNDFSEAQEAVTNLMEKGIFSGAGKRIVVEQFLKGFEMSVFILLDGKSYRIFQTAKDHKKALEGEKGANTGGMGAISPHPEFKGELKRKIQRKIIEPTIEGIIKEKLEYTGILFIGLMIKEDEPYLLEYNVRFGDPETQAILPLLETDLLEVFEHVENRELENLKLKWKNAVSCCVVAASKGYPFNYEKGFEIKVNATSDISTIFFAGVKYKNGKLLTNGGRVLAVVELGKDILEARYRVYNSIKRVHFKNIYYRKDIGKV